MNINEITPFGKLRIDQCAYLGDGEFKGHLAHYIGFPLEIHQGAEKHAIMDVYMVRSVVDQETGMRKWKQFPLDVRRVDYA
jgi:hypothetical protein